jgi:hypothetical protein
MAFKLPFTQMFHNLLINILLRKFRYYAQKKQIMGYSKI